MKRICSLLSLCLCLCLLCGCTALQDIFGQAPSPAADVSGPDTLCVTMLSIGDADCFFIRQGEHTMLVDGGRRESGEDIVAFLRKQQVKELEVVIATHPHADHIGGLYTVLDYCPVRQFLQPELPAAIVPTTSVYQSLLRRLIETQTPAKTAHPGDSFLLGDAKIEILGPLGPHEELNDQSLVFRLTYQGKRFLFMGDAEKEACDDLMAHGVDLAADVLKVPHHGSNGSTKQKFLEAVRPTYALIPCGGSDSHPGKKTMERLYQQGVTCYRADLCGMVSAIVSDRTIRFVTEKETAEAA